MSYSKYNPCEQQQIKLVMTKVDLEECDQCDGPSTANFLIETSSVSDRSESKNQRSIFVVKGFDPTLNRNSSHEFNNYLLNSHSKDELLKIQRHIDENVAKCRRYEDQVRRNLGRITNTELRYNTKSISADHCSEVRYDVFYNSGIPQVVVTPTGKIKTFNEEFSSLINYASLDCTAVFDLVESSQLPKLYQILLTALQENFLNNSALLQNNAYLSVSFPCADALSCQKPIYMTISLMNDPDPCKRCFYCILLPQPISKLGQIVYIHQDILLNKIV